MTSHHARSPRPGAPRCAATPLAALVTALAVGAGCSGDDRPFLEAAEVARSGLTALAIATPEQAPLPLVIAPGETVALGLSATATGDGAEIDGEDRAWATSDANVATVDRDGRVTGVADGTATIGIGIGGVIADPLSVAVSSAALNAVSRLGGSLEPDPCVETRYVAFGTFDDGSERLLTDAAWSVRPARADGVAPLQREDVNGAVRLVPRSPDPLVLTARARDRALSQDIDVADSLSAIEIGPPPVALIAGQGVNLVVNGTYSTADGDTRTVNITDAVDFAIDESQADFGTVSNLDGSRGRFEALAQGSVTVRASCGEYEATPVRVNVGAGGTAAGGNGGGLSFEDDRVTLSLLRNVGGVRVRVSTGSTFDDDDITNDLEFVSSDTDVVTVSEPIDSSDGVLLFPVGVGETTVRAFDDDDNSASLRVIVVEQ